MDATQLVPRANEAITLNYGQNVSYAGGYAHIAITSRGSDWYWTVTAIMIVSTFAFVGLSLTKPREQRIFHYITAAITMVASIAYFSMASNIGWAPINVEFRRHDPEVYGRAREIFYVRYIDWAITTPLLLMDLLLTAGLPWPTIFYTILIDEIMIVTGLVGALVRSSYKWGYWTFGMFALFFIGYVLVWEARVSANKLGSDIGRTFLMCGAWTTMLWFLYPIAWGVAEGGNVISPDSEAVFYGILDICAKPIFGAILIFGHRNIDLDRLGLHIGSYHSDGAVNIGSKSVANGSNGATNGTTTTTTTGTTAAVATDGTMTTDGAMTTATPAAPAEEKETV